MTLKHRPIIFGERHDSGALAYNACLYFKKNPILCPQYILFEGATTAQKHLKVAKYAFKLYKKFSAEYLNTQDENKIYAFIHRDMRQPALSFETFITKNHIIDSQIFPYGLGHVRHLSAHYFLSRFYSDQDLLKSWIPIDAKRQQIKQIAKRKIAQGTAYLYKTHQFVGNIDTIDDKILLEAAIIRSKVMADHILKFAKKHNTFIALIGARHGYDLMQHTPDLGDIFGYHPLDETINDFYYYTRKNTQISFANFKDFNEIAPYRRKITLENTKKICSNFGLRQDYLHLIK